MTTTNIDELIADIEGDVKHVSCQTVVDALLSQKKQIAELTLEAVGMEAKYQLMRTAAIANTNNLSAIRQAVDGQARLKELAELAALGIAELDKARTVTTETLTEVYTAQLSAIRKAIEKAKANRFGQPVLVSLLELYGEAIDEIDAILSAQGEKK